MIGVRHCCPNAPYHELIQLETQILQFSLFKEKAKIFRMSEQIDDEQSTLSCYYSVGDQSNLMNSLSSNRSKFG